MIWRGNLRETFELDDVSQAEHVPTGLWLEADVSESIAPRNSYVPRYVISLCGCPVFKEGAPSAG
jgi:hypothetical protein